MRTDFENMDQTARVWIYQADRRLEPAECEAIMVSTNKFLEKWTAHGHNLKSAARIFYQQFLVLSVDESFNQASGCSIDSSVHFIRELGQSFNVDFLDRSSVYYFKGEEEEELSNVPFTRVREKIDSGQLKPDTRIFNNLVTTVGEFDRNWIVPAADTWLKKYFV